MKDQFSKQSDLYVKFRPSYPQEVFDFILSLVSARHLAWDVGTGNGQIAEVLSTYFDQVIATDISEKQISNAKKNEIGPKNAAPTFDFTKALINETSSRAPI